MTDSFDAEVVLCTWVSVVAWKFDRGLKKTSCTRCTQIDRTRIAVVAQGDRADTLSADTTVPCRTKVFVVTRHVGKRLFLAAQLGFAIGFDTGPKISAFDPCAFTNTAGAEVLFGADFAVRTAGTVQFGGHNTFAVGADR